MIPYHNIDPDLIRLGPLRVRWYGIMYILGFAAARQIMRRLCRQGFLRMAQDRVDDFLVWLFCGMLIGARLFYMLVYYAPSPDAPFRWYTPLAVWEGGLAFHGGALGMFIAMIWFGRRYGVRYWNLADALVLSCPVGIALGRIGNFINGELYGRETDVPWAMQFPDHYDVSTGAWVFTTPRHPSQLYEAIGEGLVTLGVVWLVKQRVRHQGVITGVGIATYAVMRFALEFFREKDRQMSYYLGMTMGQVLCALMLAVGFAVLAYNRHRAVPVDAPAEEPGDTQSAAQ